MPAISWKDPLPLAATIIGVSIVLLSWNAMPEIVPIHFGITGRPDGFAPRPALAILPVISVIMFLTFSVGQNSDKFNIPWKLTDKNKDALIKHCRTLLWAVKMHISLSLAYLQWRVVETALGKADGLGIWFAPVFLGAIAAILAWFFIRGAKIAKD